MVDSEPSLEKHNVLAPVGDAVAEEDDLSGLLENLEVVVRLHTEGKEGDQGEENQLWHVAFHNLLDGRVCFSLNLVAIGRSSA